MSLNQNILKCDSIFVSWKLEKSDAKVVNQRFKNLFSFFISAGHGALSTTSQPLTINSYQAVTGFTQANANFSAESTADNYTVPADGIYIVSFTARVNRVSSGFRSSVAINNNGFLEGHYQVATAQTDEAEIPLSMAMDLRQNDVLSFLVYAEESGMNLNRATRSILKIDEQTSNNLTEGLAGYKEADKNVIGGGETVINGWNTNTGSGTFLAKNVLITDTGALVVLRAGIFRLTAVIIVRNNAGATG